MHICIYIHKCRRTKRRLAPVRSPSRYPRAVRYVHVYTYMHTYIRMFINAGDTEEVCPPCITQEGIPEQSDKCIYVNTHTYTHMNIYK